MAEIPDRDYFTRPLVGQVEMARLVFRASDRVRDSILELIRTDIRERMGQAALFLSSNFARSVVRIDGVLSGDDARMESEIGRAMKDADIARKRQALARYAVLKAGKRPDGEAVVALQLGVVLNPRLRDLLANSPHVPDTIVQGRSMPVRTIIPRKILDPALADQLQTPGGLNQLLYGPPSQPDEMDFQKPAADNINAYVTDMNMTFKALRRPTAH